MTADKVSTERLAELILIGERAANPDEDYQSVLAALRELQSLRLKLAEVERGTRKCMADMHADPPRDCDAPFCGCNPEWTRTIEQLQECGWQRVPPTHVIVSKAIWDAASKRLGGTDRIALASKGTPEGAA